MDSRDLRRLFQQEKTLPRYPVFYAGAHSRQYPKPLNQFRGTTKVSDVLPVAPNQVVLFAYKQAETLEDCKFWAYWGFLLPSGEFQPIAEWHYHPSHKGIHCKVPCGTDRDYTSRMLVQAPELSICPASMPDVRTQSGIEQLVGIVCEKAGIRMPAAENEDLFGVQR